MKKQINVTVDEKIIEQIKELAEKENRNFSNMIESLLREALASK